MKLYPQARCEAAVARADGLQTWSASVGAVQHQGPGWRGGGPGRQK